MRNSSSVLLDSVWAKELGVNRTGGVYRIAKHELIRKLGSQRPEGLTLCASIDGVSKAGHHRYGRLRNNASPKSTAERSGSDSSIHLLEETSNLAISNGMKVAS